MHCTQRSSTATEIVLTRHSMLHGCFTGITLVVLRRRGSNYRNNMLAHVAHAHVHVTLQLLTCLKIAHSHATWAQVVTNLISLQTYCLSNTSLPKWIALRWPLPLTSSLTFCSSLPACALPACPCGVSCKSCERCKCHPLLAS